MKRLIIIGLIALAGTAWASEPPSSPASAADYDRDGWKHWEDFDRDCQNTRHELLIARSLVEVTYTAPSGCYVATGAWQGPFTGEIHTEAEQVDVDHVIALRYAHQYGGFRWAPLLKKVFANDPENLLVVSRGENRSKGWRGPSEYMPPNRHFHCEYARLWLHLIRKYGIEAPEADSRVIMDIVSACRN